MVKVKHKGIVLVDDLVIAKGLANLFGLMFASKERVRKGLMLKVVGAEKALKRAGVTNLLVFHSLDVLFLDDGMNVVDKVCLKPFRFNYISKRPVAYFLEAPAGAFKQVKIGDRIEVQP